ncbi:uncharacterized protein LOC111046726 [Nilaparvata lugens]|uniref:uncharacterized protein LOC111046726 n=1 Tax=Nilaparvata lugens TaxID=108931 RepID=UPI00193EA1A1|nr:uncharacterized protein LOC111046726 [Nilaparvata lugens]
MSTRQDIIQCQVKLHTILALILTIYAQTTYSGDEEMLTKNLSYVLPIFGPDSDGYLQDLNGFWSYNDTTDISKYEDFDHAKFLERQPVAKAPPLDMSATAKPSADNMAQQPGGMPQQHDVANSGDGDMPVFDNNMVTNITAQLGGTAFLHCRVRKLGERTVSWVRRRDWHILTSGPLTYTNDERFQVVHAEHSTDWNLQIKYVQQRDNGTYECQVSTGSGTISHYFNLHVVVPTAYILGSGEYHIGEGSTISLVCIIENSPVPPQYVFWYHNDRMINYEPSAGGPSGGGSAPGAPNNRGGVSVSTEPGGPRTHSRLVVTHVTHADSGNYTCRASNTQQDTIYVYVSKEGDNTAAIQRHERSMTARHASSVLMVQLCLWLLR